jgi:hypothetical protein
MPCPLTNPSAAASPIGRARQDRRRPETLPPIYLLAPASSLFGTDPTASAVLPLSGITLHSVFGQSQIFQILTKYFNKTINSYETKYMQYENIFYDNSNDGYVIL